MTNEDKHNLKIAALIVGVYYLLANKATRVLGQSTTLGTGTATGSTSTGTTGTPVASASAYPITYGKYNSDVKLLQAALAVNQDGVIGPGTLAEWRKYDSIPNTSFKIPNRAALANLIAVVQSKRGISGIRKY